MSFGIFLGRTSLVCWSYLKFFLYVQAIESLEFLRDRANLSLENTLLLHRKLYLLKDFLGEME